MVTDLGDKLNDQYKLFNETCNDHAQQCATVLAREYGDIAAKNASSGVLFSGATVKQFKVAMELSIELFGELVDQAIKKSKFSDGLFLGKRSQLESICGNAVADYHEKAYAVTKKNERLLSGFLDKEFSFEAHKPLIDRIYRKLQLTIRSELNGTRFGKWKTLAAFISGGGFLALVSLLHKNWDMIKHFIGVK
jgi:hypothetical protein